MNITTTTTIHLTQQSSVPLSQFHSNHDAKFLWKPGASSLITTSQSPFFSGRRRRAAAKHIASIPLPCGIRPRSKIQTIPHSLLFFFLYLCL